MSLDRDINKMIEALGPKIPAKAAREIWDVVKDGDVDKHEFDRLAAIGTSALIEFLRRRKVGQKIVAWWRSRPIVQERRATGKVAVRIRKKRAAK